MEPITIANDAKLFDEIVHNSPPEAGDLSITFKPQATSGGNGGVVISFSALINDVPTRVQAVTTANNLIGAGRIIEQWQGQAGN